MVIENGKPEIAKTNTTVAISEGALYTIPKLRSEWTNKERKRANLDNVARDILYKTIDKTMFNKIKSCKTDLGQVSHDL